VKEFPTSIEGSARRRPRTLTATRAARAPRATRGPGAGIQRCSASGTRSRHTTLFSPSSHGTRPSSRAVLAYCASLQ
jgi:hypothetical protein